MIIVTLLLVIFIEHETYITKISQTQTTIAQLYGKIHTYKDKYGRVVLEKKSIELEKAKFKFLSDSLQEMISNFKKPKDIIVYKYTIKTDTVFIKPDTVYIDKDRLFHFTNDDGWNKVSGTVYRDGVKLEPLSIRNEISIVSGWKKTGFLKKKSYNIDVVNSNPYIKTQGITHFVVVPSKRWHEKWYITLPMGIATGMILQTAIK